MDGNAIPHLRVQQLSLRYLPTKLEERPITCSGCTVISTLQQWTTAGPASNPGYAILVGEDWKMAAHAEICKQMGILFVSHVVDSWEARVMKLSIQQRELAASKSNQLLSIPTAHQPILAAGLRYILAFYTFFSAMQTIELDKAIVLPNLEHCCPIRDPSSAMLYRKMEAVHRFASRMYELVW